MAVLNRHYHLGIKEELSIPNFRNPYFFETLRRDAVAPGWPVRRSPILLRSPIIFSNDISVLQHRSPSVTSPTAVIFSGDVSSSFLSLPSFVSSSPKSSTPSFLMIYVSFRSFLSSPFLPL
ncbi:hypothetical protein HN873_013265 [Arachis hypogaea]|nr:uncharacterized protein DS421_4g127850 [Arachis hypogaea]